MGRDRSTVGRRSVGALVAALILLSISSLTPARADTFLLRNGSRVRGILESEEKGPDGKTWLSIRTSYGRVKLRKSRVGRTITNKGGDDTLLLSEARFFEIRGQAFVSKDDGKTWERVPWRAPADSAGTTTDASPEGPKVLPVLHAGERLKTAAESEVVLDVSFGVVVVAAESELTLRDEGAATLLLTRGRLGAKLEDLPPEQRFRVETPQASMAVKGTVFVASADDRCHVAEGVVELRPAGNAEGVDVPAGEAADALGARVAPTVEETRLAERARSATGFPVVDWCVVPGGEYYIVEGESSFDTRLRKTKLRSFLMAQFELNVAQFTAYERWSGRGVSATDANGSLPAAVPIEAVRLAAAWFRGRLPTDNEWEAAANQGGRWYRSMQVPQIKEIVEREWVLDSAGSLVPDTATAGGRYQVDGKLIDSVEFRELSAPYVRAVGLRSPNRFGLYDMLGNFREWAEGDPARLPEPAKDAVPSPLDGLVTRGGSFLDPASSSGPAARGVVDPGTWSKRRDESRAIALRLVRAVE